MALGTAYQTIIDDDYAPPAGWAPHPAASGERVRYNTHHGTILAVEWNRDGLDAQVAIVWDDEGDTTYHAIDLVEEDDLGAVQWMLVD